MPSLLDYLMNPEGWNQLQQSVQGTRIQNDPQMQNIGRPSVTPQDLKSILAAVSTVGSPNPVMSALGQTYAPYVPNAMQYANRFINKPQNATQTPTVAPQSTQMAQPTSNPSIPEYAQPGANGGKFNFKDFMLKLGIPLATTGVGLAVPGALPGATGFNQGYVGELTKESDAQRKKRLESDNKVFRLVDENGDIVKEIPIKKGDYTKVKGADEDVLAGLIKEIMGGSPATKTDQQVVDEVNNKFLTGSDLPDASKYPNGHILTDNETGKQIGVAKDGKWLSTQ